RRARTDLALLYVDLDGFKQLNDQRGHQAGDEALRRLAMALRAAVRGCDSLARVGGDEFVLVLPAMGRHAARRVAARVRRAAALAGLLLSVGIATLREEGRGDPVRSLLAAADRAMYRDKRAHKGRSLSAAVANDG